MTDNNKFEIKFCLILLAICILIYFIICNINTLTWNNGYCKCGGKWEYQEAVGHRYTTNYLYKCDKCGRIVEFESYYETEANADEDSD